jgi:hypothetical protein
MQFKKIIAAITVMIVLSGFAYAQAPNEPKPVHAPNALPGTEPEMLNPHYWISLQPDADTVIMTPAEIDRFNEKNRKRTVILDDQFGRRNPLEGGLIGYTPLINRGVYMNMVKPLELPASITGDSLRVWFGQLKEWLASRDFYDGRNAIYSEEMKQNLIRDMNEQAIPATVNRRWGIVVNHTNLRFYPTDVPGYSDTRVEMDLFQETSLLSGNEVAVLHESVTGEFLYVESHLARGWAPAVNIALGTKAEVQKVAGAKNFLMATGDKISIYGDPRFANFARFLYFSSTMPLAKKDARGYVLNMPYRKPAGSLGIAPGYIRPDADVHVGYLPYTKRNVITQIFKLLNTPYGWIDQHNKRACSGTMRVLLQSFGIEVGAYPSTILPASDHIVYYESKMNTEEKTKAVEQLEPIITMAGNAGHIVLLLGKAGNGKLYFMHQAGWGYDEDKQHYIVNRVSLNAADFKWYSIGAPNVFTTFRP